MTSCHEELTKLRAPSCNFLTLPAQSYLTGGNTAGNIQIYSQSVKIHDINAESGDFDCSNSESCLFHYSSRRFLFFFLNMELYLQFVELFLEHGSACQHSTPITLILYRNQLSFQLSPFFHNHDAVCSCLTHNNSVAEF